MGAGNGRDTRQRRSTPDDELEREFAVGPPEERRRLPETGSSDLSLTSTRNSATGRIPCAPIKPRIWRPKDAKAMR
jgi:hypothetical protein